QHLMMLDGIFNLRRNGQQIRLKSSFRVEVKDREQEFLELGPRQFGHVLVKVKVHKRAMRIDILAGSGTYRGRGRALDLNVLVPLLAGWPAVDVETDVVALDKDIGDFGPIARLASRSPHGH